MLKSVCAFSYTTPQIITTLITQSRWIHLSVSTCFSPVTVSELFHCPPLLWMLNKVIWIFVILIAACCELSDAEPETGEKDWIQPFTSSMKTWMVWWMKKREWETRPLHPIQCQRRWKGQHGLSEGCRHTIHNEWGHPASSVCVSAMQACGLHRNGPSHKGFKRGNTFSARLTNYKRIKT